MPSAETSGSLFTGLSEIYRHLSAGRRKQFYRLLVLMVLGALAELATIGSVIPFLALLTRGSAASGSVWLANRLPFGISTVAEGAALFALVAIAAGALRLLLLRAVQDFAYGVGHELLVDIQRRVLGQSYSFHLEHNSSSLLATIEQVEVLMFDLILPALQALVAAVLALFILAALIAVDPFAALVAGGASAAVYAAVSLIARRRLRANSSTMAPAYESRMKIAQESLGGIRDIIIDDSRELHVDLFRRTDRALNLARASNGFIAAAPRYVIETVGIVIIVAVALVVARRPGGVAAAIPVLGAIALGAQRLLPLLQQIYSGWSSASGSVSLLTRMTNFLQLQVGERRNSASAALPLRQAITIKNLTFAYPGRRRPALDSISCEIPAGSSVALVGENGSGKTTLADLLMGLLEPQSGEILVDGEPLVGNRRRQWQRSIAHVPQSLFLADTSIARNIALAVGDRSLDMHRVIAAARKAQLHAFVESLPEGYETVIGERGIRLSGGQRQRLGLARAIYKQVPVLVLDEATSALDEPTEAAVMDALDALRREGVTLLFIAHRRSAIERAEKIIMLERGRLKTVEEILGRATGAPVR